MFKTTIALAILFLALTSGKPHRTRHIHNDTLDTCLNSGSDSVSVDVAPTWNERRYRNLKREGY